MIALGERASALQAPPYEVMPQQIQYVNPLNTGVANGLQMATGFVTLDDALNPFVNPSLGPGTLDLTIELRLLGNQIYIPNGTVRFPAGSPDPRHATFSIPRQVLRISGGWTGLEGPNDPPAGRPSTLSGDRALPGDPSDNCYHVVVPLRDSFTTSRDAQWLNFLVVEGGYADGAPQTIDVLGGGILVAGAQLRLTEVTVRDCYAEFGGGVAVFQAAGAGGTLISPSFWTRRSIFRDCNAEFDGGAIFLDRCSRAVQVNMVCRNNAAGRNGGGVWIGSRIPDHAIVNAVMHDNFAGELGGAIYVSDPIGPNAGLRILNGTIAYNTANVDQGTAGGSGIYIEYDTQGEPGGLDRSKIFNTILYANSGGNGDDNLLLAPHPTAGMTHFVDVSNCFIGGRTTNPATALTSGTQGFGLPFIDAGLTGEVPGWVNPATRNFRLVSTSRCIDQGTDRTFDSNTAGTDWVDLDDDLYYFEQTVPPNPQIPDVREELPREHYMGDEQWLTGATSTRESKVQGAGTSTLPDIGEDGGQVSGSITDIGAYEYRIYAIGV